MDLKINKEKFEIFLEVTKVLNKQGIIPILFGSLGLNKIIGEFGEANDIDILVLPELINGKWQSLIKTMKELKFELKDEKEHEFIKDGEIIAFGNQNDLVRDFKLDLTSLITSEQKRIRFKELSAEQYLLCYQFMLRDTYRQEKRGNADQGKIKLIKKYLEKDKV